MAENSSEPPVGEPPRPSRIAGLDAASTKDLMATLQSNDRDHDDATREKVKKAFEPMDVAIFSDPTAVVRMSDDDGYSTLSKCKIGSAVMLPYCLNPQWKVSHDPCGHKQMFMLIVR
jgi:hypothetical protein